MYGRTAYGRLSRFIREEVSDTLLRRNRPKTPPPRQPYGSHSGYGYGERRREIPVSGEMSRPVTRTTTPAPRGSRAESFGVKKIAPGTRVAHPTFGAGVILSARDMGGDVLYEVRFDTGVEKKLMATYAKLKEI